MKGKKQGGGERGHQNGRRKSFRSFKRGHRNPRRGGPGILLTCEMGREVKCRREGLEILNHTPLCNPTTTAAAAGTDSNNNDNNNNTEDVNLSLEEEIAMLKRKQQSRNNDNSSADRANDSDSEPFAFFDTGCRGTVPVLYTVPGSELVPLYIKPDDRKLATNDGDDDNGNRSPQNHDAHNKAAKAPPPAVDPPPTKTDPDEKQKALHPSGNNDKDRKLQRDPSPPAKRLKTENRNDATEKPDSNQQEDPKGPDTTDKGKTNNSESKDEPPTTTTTSLAADASSLSSSQPRWDPVEAVERIIRDVRAGKSAVSSRFITRIIPLQATCFSNQSEICHVAKHLFQSHQDLVGSNPPNATTTSTTTFAIQAKKRNCSHLQRQDVISWVAAEAPKEWKVDLSKPDYTVVVEICKTLCGMSIIRKCTERFGKFNLLPLPEKDEEEEE